MSVNIPAIVRLVLAGYNLPLDGDHGVTHWARVYENGLRLAEETGADREIVRLFAVLHDSQRMNESYDSDHGPRAGVFARTILKDHFDASDPRLRLLIRACDGHTKEHTHPDVTIRTCWDTDRLDLGRVGITPNPRLLCNDAAKHPDMIAWAHGRACFRVIPALVKEEWGLDFD